MTVDHKLTAKQRAFVEAYLTNGRNAAKAYRAAYDTTASPQRVAEEAATLLRHPKITPIIERASRKARERVGAVVERYAINKGCIADELARLGRAQIKNGTAWKKSSPFLIPGQLQAGRPAE